MPQDPNIQRKIELEADQHPIPSGGKSWFFGIGINQYQHFPRLNNAVKDVKDIAKLLQADYDLLPENTITLYDKAATRRNIIVALDQLQQQVGEADKLLIYYSGHGHLNKETGKGYWIPTESEVSNTVDYIRNSTIREYIETFRTLHTLLISDSCFSGTLFVRGASRSTEAIQELARIPSRWAICSGRHDEAVYDGPPGGNSPFAESIMDSLKLNKQPIYNVAKLINRVVEQTRSNYEQLPEGCPMYGVGHKGGQYVFLRKSATRDEWAEAQKAGTTAAYLEYLENHPDGQYAEEARRRILEPESRPNPKTTTQSIPKETSPKAAPKKKVNRPAKQAKPKTVIQGQQPVSAPARKPKEAHILLAPTTVSQLEKALKSLLQKTDDDAFLIIEERRSGKFVQFAGNKGEGLLFNFPMFSMNSEEKAQAVEVLQQYADYPIKNKGKKMMDFLKKVGEDTDLAIELVSRVMLDIFDFAPDVKLTLNEN